MKSHGEMEQKDKQNNCKKSDFVKSMIAEEDSMLKFEN